MSVRVPTVSSQEGSVRLTGPCAAQRAHVLPVYALSSSGDDDDSW